MEVLESFEILYRTNLSKRLL